MPSDTERLDWLIEENGAEWHRSLFDGKGFWFQWVHEEREQITPEASSPREAIDLAIAKEASDQAYLREAIDYSRSLQP